MYATEFIKCQKCNNQTPILDGMAFCAFCGKALFLFSEVTRKIGRTQRYEVLDRQGWKCNICGTRLKYDNNIGLPFPIAHIDHIHPFTKRKTYPKGEVFINETSNLQALCPDCNLKKNKREIN